MAKNVTSYRTVSSAEIQQVLQTQHSHSSEVCLWIVALKSNHWPTLAYSTFEFCVRHQIVPQLYQFLFMFFAVAVVTGRFQLQYLSLQLSISVDLQKTHSK
jgi:hypothetical protein